LIERNEIDAFAVEGLGANGEAYGPLYLREDVEAVLG
jgi:hypothetical protein